MENNEKTTRESDDQAQRKPYVAPAVVEEVDFEGLALAGSGGAPGAPCSG